MHKRIGWASLAVFSLALAGAGAASADSKDTAKKTQTGTMSGASCPTDDTAKLRSVLTFLHTANQNEIKHNKMAMDRAQSQDVKSFADRMVREHTDADKKLTDLAGKKGIDLTPMQPADPIHAAVMSTDSKSEQALSGKKGAAFDAAFMGPEVMEHNLVLSVIEEGQKVTKDQDVKNLLNDLHNAVSQHKEHASNLIDKMKSGTAIGGGPSDQKSDMKDKTDKSKPDMKDKSKGWLSPDKKGTGGGPIEQDHPDHPEDQK